MKNDIMRAIVATTFASVFALCAQAAPHRHHIPLGRVAPQIAPDYKLHFGGIFSSQTTRERIASYKECMYPEEGRLDRAFSYNFASKDTVDIAGSAKQLAYEVCLADAMGLSRYEEQRDIENGKSANELVEITGDGLVFSEMLPPERRYARPWVKAYVEEVAREMKEHFAGAGTPLRIGSLVRSFKDQRHQFNSPATCVTEICSSHTTGSAVDIAVAPRFVGSKERMWLSERLLADRKKGVIVFIEEHHPPHFHVLVIPPPFIAP